MKDVIPLIMAPSLPLFTQEEEKTYLLFPPVMITPHYYWQKLFPSTSSAPVSLIVLGSKFSWGVYVCVWMLVGCVSMCMDAHGVCVCVCMLMGCVYAHDMCVYILHACSWVVYVCTHV